ncbi:hypothetical protein OL229_05925 [Neisseriaceae bacterium JH1-16]|nr:hypothetical protein [Neisseriaceae bacterium JH1-16]
MECRKPGVCRLLWLSCLLLAQTVWAEPLVQCLSADAPGRPVYAQLSLDFDTPGRDQIRYQRGGGKAIALRYVKILAEQELVPGRPHEFTYLWREVSAGGQGEYEVVIQGAVLESVRYRDRCSGRELAFSVSWPDPNGRCW